MSILVSFSGNTYTIPEDGSQSWPELSDYLVALSTAATTLSMNYSARIATTSPQSILPTDTIVFMNLASSSAAVLPAGVTGQFIGVYDFTGAAAANTISITGTSGQLINGAASYTIQSNYGGVLLQFNGTGWQIIAESSLDSILRTMYRKNNTTNSSIIEDQLVALSAFPSVADGNSCTFTIAGTNFFKFYVSLSDGKGILCTCNFANTEVSCLADPSDIFLSSDAGTGIYVSKSAGASVISVKNRMGISEFIEIHVESGRISAATNWA